MVPGPRAAIFRYVVVGGYDRQIGLGFPVQRHVEIARKDLPFRAVVELGEWLSAWDLIFMA